MKKMHGRQGGRERHHRASRTRNKGVIVMAIPSMPAPFFFVAELSFEGTLIEFLTDDLATIDAQSRPFGTKQQKHVGTYLP